MGRQKQLPMNMAVPSWLLFFYSLPSKPVSSRVMVWRKLQKAGAVQLKGSVYILPAADDNYEFLQWLVSEISGMKGEAAFVRTQIIENIENSEIVELFDGERSNEYRKIEKALDDLDMRLFSARKGGVQNVRAVSGQYDKLLKSFNEIKRIDFFSSGSGARLYEKLLAFGKKLADSSEGETKKDLPIETREIADFRGKTWITRKKPFIDRMASAWLIRRFIDADAKFGFADSADDKAPGGNSVTFDMQGGQFTHSGNKCTFEVLIRTFGLKDKALRKISEIVHDLDIKDNKFRSEEATGIEEILTGIRKSEKDDAKALVKGMAVFEMIYLAKS